MERGGDRAASLTGDRRGTTMRKHAATTMPAATPRRRTMFEIMPERIQHLRALTLGGLPVFAPDGQLLSEREAKRLIGRPARRRPAPRLRLVP